MGLERQSTDLSRVLAGTDYLRARLKPTLRDPNYLVFEDLRHFIARSVGSIQGKVFDYGCGGSPYEELFPAGTEYIGADITPGPEVDRVLLASGMTGEPGGSYDLVLSTQVLEHVSNPESYLKECFRILKPGGILLLTTHGMFEEHGCPHDYYLWTSQGLETLVAAAGFSVRKSSKLTAGVRAVVFLLNRFVEHLGACPGSACRFAFKCLRKLSRLCLFGAFNFFAAKCTSQAEIAGSEENPFYILVAVIADKAG